MKYFFLLLFSLSSVLTFACSCEIPVYYCDYSKDVAAAEKGVILLGEYLSTDTIEENLWAYEFKILDVLRGQVEIGGLLYNNPKHVNTDSTIWFRGGPVSLCFYSNETEKVVISSIFGEDGYTPDICAPGVLNIDENDVILGGPWELDFRLKLEDLDFYIDETCVSATEEIRNHLSESISIYPNPTTDELVIETSDVSLQKLNYTVFDLLGNSRSSGVLEEKRKMVSLGEFPDGIYFLSLELDGIYYSEKIVKATF